MLAPIPDEVMAELQREYCLRKARKLILNAPAETIDLVFSKHPDLVMLDVELDTWYPHN